MTLHSFRNYTGYRICSAVFWTVSGQSRAIVMQGFMPGNFASSGFTTQMGPPDALQQISKTGKNPHGGISSLSSMQPGAVAGQQHRAAPQLAEKLKRPRVPDTGSKPARQKKKSRGEDTLQNEQILAEEQESKQLMQMINAMMQVWQPSACSRCVLRGGERLHLKSCRYNAGKLTVETLVCRTRRLRMTQRVCSSSRAP